MENKKQYIWILDFIDSKVYRYEYKEVDLVEDFIEDKGHDSVNCQWMITSNKNIEFVTKSKK